MGKGLGPGDYELRPKNFLPNVFLILVELVVFVKKTTSKGNAGFATKKERFKEGARSGGPGENPGPGTYNPKLTVFTSNYYYYY